MKLGFAFLAGLTAGAALGVLYASRPGKETRKAIRRKAQEGMDQAASAARNVGAQVKDAAERGKEHVTDALEAGRQAYRQQTAGT